MMKKLFSIVFCLMLCISAFAQQKIQLRSADRAECVKSDMTSLKASFSFSTIEAEDVETKGGEFSWLSMPNTVIGGNEGDPQIPVVNELIAIPFGAQPTITITSYSSRDYKLSELGVKTLIPRQPSLRKDQRPEDVPFVMNKAAYEQTRGLHSEPVANVFVDGVMRGVQVGKMTIEPVSYDPVNNTIRVFNDIEVEVSFDGADATATEDMLVKTYSPYFDIVYKQLFNGRSVSDVYSRHPDLYKTPVKMIVITTSTYANNATFQNWVKWKKQKGIYTTVYTTSTTGSTASAIKSFIRNQYSSSAPTFVVLVGDTGDIPASTTSTVTEKVTDLYYSSTTDSDLYPEMYCSRMPISSATELANLLNKIMTYEQYTMSDPSYLSKVLLIAGADDTWAPKVGRPTINYAANNYFNTANGFTNVYKYVSSSYSGCYNYLSSGVGFANYTAHGDNTMWYNPQFTTSNANSLTNTGKYFWAMGNCCLAANWGYSGTCLAEALLRASNKGAFGYIGSCPETLWYEDYYFGVGATTVFNQTPTLSQTSTGCYDAMFDDTGFNTLNSVPFIGNLAVAYAHAGSYQYSVTDQYYWEAYHCLGDGSVMPYHTQPAANNVSHNSVLPIGANSFTVNADAGSYVGITVNNEIIGVAQVPASGTVDVSITAQNTAGTAHIVVTRQQRQPYIQDIPIAGVTQYSISASANPTAGGTVTGAGQYYESTNCTLTATANEGYTFVKWTKNGAQVSTDATISFTVSGNANYVAVFSLNNYAIAAAAYPTAGGSVTGAGNYNHFTTATLTATPAAGYMFVNWTMDGVEVSANATYTFTVTGAGNYTANFSLIKYQVSTTPSSAEGGTVAIIGSHISQLAYDFEDGTSQGWTLLQGPDSDSPHNWMHCVNYTAYDLSSGYGHNASNGFMLSESLINNSYGVHPDNYLVSPQVLLGGSINFWATNLDDEYGAEHFAVAVSTNGNTDVNDFTTVQEWTLPVVRTGDTRNVFDDVWYEYTVDLSAYRGMGYIAIRHFDCYEQWLLCVDDITITEGYYFNYGESCTVTATPNEGFEFVNWTENGDEVSTEASYTFTISSGHNLVANFEEVQTIVTQTSELVTGLNWWTANVGTTLADLEAALGANGLKIMDGNGNYVTYNPVYGWGNNPNLVLVPGQMYKIQTSTACEIELTGEAINPSEVEITLHPGTNWIGFIGSAPVALSAALSNMTPTVGDVISGGGDMYARYTAYGWGGNLTYLVPGEGYIYNSKASTDVTFIYSVSKAFKGDTNGMDYEYRWTAPAPGLYADRNHVTAQVMIEGDMQTSVDIEVAAFIGDEVRGRVRLIDGYTYLTVFGNPEDVGQAVTFKAYDHATGAEYGICQLTVPFSGEEEMHYDGDAYMLRFSKDGNAGVEDIFAYQNGSDIVVNGEGTLQVYDVMGRFVGSYEINGVETIEALPMGVYIFRMTGETVKTQKIVVR